MVPLSPSFTPTILRGVEIDPQNPFKFEFIVDRGDQELSPEELKAESEKVIRYFLAGLALPEDKLWVNLSPYEGDRIVDDVFGQTEMGRDLLAQDYILKQITASLIYPEDDFGRAFWQKIYKKAYENFQTTNIPINTFNKVWIVPDKATVYAQDNKALVIESTMNVMLEQDYLSLEKNLFNDQLGTQKQKEGTTKDVSAVSSQVVREIVLPELLKEVNEGKNFAQLRQVYNSLILANWFKANLKQSILNKLYSDQNKVGGIAIDDKEMTKKIYDQYLVAFKKGVCDLMKVEYDPYMKKQVPRKYFSGGFNFTKGASPVVVNGAQGEQMAGSAIASWTRKTGDKFVKVYTVLGNAASNALRSLSGSLSRESISQSKFSKGVVVLLAELILASSMGAYANTGQVERGVLASLDQTAKTITIKQNSGIDQNNTYDLISPPDGGGGLDKEKEHLKNISTFTSQKNQYQLGRFFYGEADKVEGKYSNGVAYLGVNLKNENGDVLGTVNIVHKDNNFSYRLDMPALNIRNKLFSSEKDFKKATEALLIDETAKESFISQIEQFYNAPVLTERGFRIDPRDFESLKERIENGIFPNGKVTNILSDQGAMNDTKPFAFTVLNAANQRVALVLLRAKLDRVNFKDPASFEFMVVVPASAEKVKLATRISGAGYTPTQLANTAFHSEGTWIAVKKDIAKNLDLENAFNNFAPRMVTGRAQTLADRMIDNSLRTYEYLNLEKSQKALDEVLTILGRSVVIQSATGAQNTSPQMFKSNIIQDTANIKLTKPPSSLVNSVNVTASDTEMEVQFDIVPDEAPTTKVIAIDLSTSMTPEKIQELKQGLLSLASNFGDEEYLRIYRINEEKKHDPIIIKVSDLKKGLAESGAFLESLPRTPTTFIVPQLKNILHDVGNDNTEIFVISDFRYSVENTNVDVEDSKTKSEFAKNIAPALRPNIKIYAHHVPDPMVQEPPIMVNLMQENSGHFTVQQGSYNDLSDTWQRNHAKKNPADAKVTLPKAENIIFSASQNDSVVIAEKSNGQSVVPDEASDLLNRSVPSPDGTITRDPVTQEIIVPYVAGAETAKITGLGKTVKAPILSPSNAEQEILVVDVSGSVRQYEPQIKAAVMQYIDLNNVAGVCFFSGSGSFQSFLGLNKTSLKAAVGGASFGGSTDINEAWTKTAAAIQGTYPQGFLGRVKFLSDLQRTEGRNFVEPARQASIFNYYMGKTQVDFFLFNTPATTIDNNYANRTYVQNLLRNTSVDEILSNFYIQRSSYLVAFTEALRTTPEGKRVHVFSDFQTAFMASLYQDVSVDVPIKNIERYDMVKVQYFDKEGELIIEKVLRVEDSKVSLIDPATRLPTGQNNEAPSTGLPFGEMSDASIVDVDGNPALIFDSEEQARKILAVIQQEAGFMPSISNKIALSQIKQMLEAEVQAASSSSTVTQPEYGGIDFKTDQFDLKTQGAGIDMDIPFDENMLQNFNPDTVAPIIIQIVPIPNPQMILGLSGSSFATPS